MTQENPRKFFFNHSNLLKEQELAKGIKIPGFHINRIALAGNPNQADYKERLWYKGFCTELEIDRILNPQNAHDYLLKIRADAAADHSRLYRVMLARAKKHGRHWTFEKHFRKEEFVAVLSVLPSELEKTCAQVPAGYALSNDPNGCCMKSTFGNIILISESLRYFLYFMNLACLNFSIAIPGEIRGSSMMIAIRTMLQSEALDFDIDPRGDIPKSVERRVREVTNQQLRFIIAHEYAHHALDHLNTATMHVRPLFSVSSQKHPENFDFYGYAQKRELEADLWALREPKPLEPQQLHILNSAVLFFAYLDIYQFVYEQIFPRITSYNTHPSALDRIENVKINFPESKDFVKFENIIQMADSYKADLEKHVALNIETFEEYGAIYLDRWRSKTLLDRVDY